jgi:hypothetical protein
MPRVSFDLALYLRDTEQAIRIELVVKTIVAWLALTCKGAMSSHALCAFQRRELKDGYIVRVVFTSFPLG